ncbi:MAG: hypothetical protein GY953_18230, partial [bacterium]|nr:hypothetical protein [bacterium]
MRWTPPIAAACLTAGLLLFAPSAQPAFVTFGPSGFVGLFPNPGTVTSDIVVVDPTNPQVLSSGNNVAVSFRRFRHNWAGDLTITLTYDPGGPNQTSASLMTNPGGLSQSNNLNPGAYRFYPGFSGDLVSSLASGNTAPGDYFPSSDSAGTASDWTVFNGLQAGSSAGITWRLTITDAANNPGADRGRLRDWSLAL